MTVPRALIAFLLTACLLTGCDDKGATPSTRPGPQSSTESPPPRRTAKGWVVPNVVGVMRAAATRTLRQQGFKAEVVRRNACPPGVVVAQRPTGRAPRGTTVRLVVLDSATGSCAMSPATGPAQQLISWAQGEGDAPEFADRVDLRIGNSAAQTLDDPLDRESWESLCEGGAEVVCLSPLTIGMDRQFAVRTVPGIGHCLDIYEPLPTRLIDQIWRSVALVATDANASCLDALALQVWVDVDDRIKTVNLLLGSP